jgi:hypothetical protein
LALETDRRASFSSLFRSEWKLILYSTTMYVYCVYPAISKSPKQLPNFLKIAETSVVLIVFNCVVCDVSAYTVAIHESGTRNALLGQWRQCLYCYCFFLWLYMNQVSNALLYPWPNNTEVYLIPFISTQNHTIAG